VKILKLPVGQLRANCYIVFDEKTTDSIIIDPGDEADFLIQKILDHELTPRYIVATHAHFDHIQAVNELKLAFDVPFLMHKSDETLLKHYRKSALYFTKVDPGPAPRVDRFLTDQDEIKIENYKLKIIHTPGHTPGGLCLYNNEVIFTGDTIFAKGAVGRTDFPYSNPLELANSINKILNLNSRLIILPGHEESSTIAGEKIYHLG